MSNLTIDTKEVIFSNMEKVYSQIKENIEKVENLAESFGLSVNVNQSNTFAKELGKLYPTYYNFSSLGFTDKPSKEVAKEVEFFLNNSDLIMSNSVFIHKIDNKKFQLKINEFQESYYRFSTLMRYCNINEGKDANCWQIIKVYKNSSAIIGFSDKKTFEKFLKIIYTKTSLNTELEKRITNKELNKFNIGCYNYSIFLEMIKEYNISLGNPIYYNSNLFNTNLMSKVFENRIKLDK